ncbi:MAG: GTP 3',8-cyclase MoaA [Stecheria intestinalis]|nr:GTP 3',8-cyclase MoaA [Stecheria intestinalis]
MKDSFGREINYLRISITDRCNLRCRYCMPQGIHQVPMHEILTYEEILEIAEAAASLGITKIKVTGGEPLVRLGCAHLVAQLKEIPGIEQVTMTTNGILLKQNLTALKEAGIDAINVSLDTLNPEVFQRITGSERLQDVIDGIEASVSAGIRTKVNTVLQTGVNDDEWKDLIRLAKDLPIDVRFIEMMPIGYGKKYPPVSNEDLKRQIEAEFGRAEEDHSIHGNGPAEYIHLPCYAGSIGFIGAIHGKFCSSCNRIRLTSRGRLKPCLCYGDTVDLRGILRQKKHHEELLKQAIAEAVSRKPEAHCFEQLNRITEEQEMIEIGG